MIYPGTVEVECKISTSQISPLFNYLMINPLLKTALLSIFRKVLFTFLFYLTDQLILPRISLITSTLATGILYLSTCSVFILAKTISLKGIP